MIQTYADIYRKTSENYAFYFLYQRLFTKLSAHMRVCMDETRAIYEEFQEITRFIHKLTILISWRP